MDQHSDPTLIDPRPARGHMPTRSRRLLAGAAAAALLLAACGGDDPEPAAAAPEPAATPAATNTADPADPADDADASTVTITAVDYGFEGVPDSVPAGTTLTLTNSSDVEVHEIVAVQIADGVELSVEELLELPDDEADQHLVPGPPATVIVAPPGEDGFAVLGDGALTEPGRYALVCFIPVGADAEEFLAAGEDSDGPPDVAGGPPHFVEGMFAELTVE